jgi:hypothetical protein
MYTLNKFQPATVPVQVIHNPGDASAPATTVTDPNPVFAELQPAGPLPKHKGTKPKRVTTPKPAAAGGSQSPFPDPNATPSR